MDKDILEEAKEVFNTRSKWNWGLIEKFKEQGLKLISEVERLRSNVIFDGMTKEVRRLRNDEEAYKVTIDSLTKELAEVKEELNFINSQYAEADDKDLTWDARALKYKARCKQLEEVKKERDEGWLKYNESNSENIKLDVKIKKLEAENVELKEQNKTIAEACKQYEERLNELEDTEEENAELREKVEEWKKTASNYRIRLSNHLRKEPKI